jgi:hypothetical protein
MVSFTQAQQVDVAAGAGTVWSSEPSTASLAFPPPAMKGGIYPSLGVQYLRENHLGINVEGSFRATEAIYNSYQPYRPILYDANAVYARTLATKARGDFMAGIGGQTLLFYSAGACGPNGGCRSFVNSTHFALHAGFDVRYYVWRNFFVRPEVHYYFVPNNFEFHSDNVFRLGVSIGHTFGSHANPKPPKK